MRYLLVIALLFFSHSSSAAFFKVYALEIGVSWGDVLTVVNAKVENCLGLIYEGSGGSTAAPDTDACIISNLDDLSVYSSTHRSDLIIGVSNCHNYIYDGQRVCDLTFINASTGAQATKTISLTKLQPTICASGTNYDPASRSCANSCQVPKGLKRKFSGPLVNGNSPSSMSFENCEYRSCGITVMTSSSFGGDFCSTGYHSPSVPSSTTITTEPSTFAEQLESGFCISRSGIEMCHTATENNCGTVNGTFMCLGTIGTSSCIQGASGGSVCPSSSTPTQVPGGTPYYYTGSILTTDNDVDTLDTPSKFNVFTGGHFSGTAPPSTTTGTGGTGTGVSNGTGTGKCSGIDCSDDFTLGPPGDPSSWWESRYPDGMASTFNDFSNSHVRSGPMGNWLSSWSLPSNGSVPIWSVLTAGLPFDLGILSFTVPLSVWLAVRAIVLFSAAIAAFRIIFGT